MSFELWMTFALASAALLTIPGPTVLLVVSYALGGGRRTGWATVPGVTLGDFTAMTVSLLGAGAILAASATLFTVMKLAGAAYLVWLGIQLWRQPDGGGFLISARPPVGRIGAAKGVGAALRPLPDALHRAAHRAYPGDPIRSREMGHYH